MVQKYSGTWPGVTPKLDLIQLMGWPYKPTQISVKDSQDKETVLDPSSYAYIETTKLLNLMYEFDMNQGYTVHFQ